MTVLASLLQVSRENRQLQLVYVILVAMAVLIAVSIVQQGWEVALRKEHGGVERASLILAIAAAGLAALRIVGERRGIWSVPALLALFALRELDFHDWWFEPGLLHTAIFTSDAPLWQKGVSAVTMAGILWVFVDVVRRGARPFFDALRAGRAWVWLVIVGVGLAVLSVMLDSLPARRAGELSEFAEALSSVTEEGGELVLFACLLLAVAVWPAQARR